MVLSSNGRTPCGVVVSQDRKDRNISTIYGMIPSVVRSRIPVLASIRQSARNVVYQPRSHYRVWSLPNTHPPDSTLDDSRSQSAGRIAVGALESSSTMARQDNRGDGEGMLVTGERHVAASNLHTGGVDWDVAGAGVKLWLNARAQAQLGAGDSVALRAMHIDALRYMNMAVPSDLSESETDSIRTSLHPLLRREVEGQVVATKPNALRQGIAQAVCWIVAMVFIMVPLVMTALNKALVYERQHKLTERALSGSAELTRALGERGLDVADAFVRFKGTPIGEACSDSISYIIEGVTGGVNDGLVQSTHGRFVLQNRGRR